jgi:hypothetical protein
MNSMNSGELTPEEVQCVICALRVRLSSTQMTKIDPASKCQHKQGWTVCPNLKLSLTEARHASSKAPRPVRVGPRRV